MNATRLLVGLLALAGLVTGAYFLVRTDPAADLAVVGPAIGPSAVDPTGGEAASLTSPDAQNDVGETGGASAARSEIAEVAQGPTRAVRVAVRTDGAAPVDPELSVVAVSAAALRGESTGELLARLRSGSDSKVAFARAPVGGNGVADLQLPADLVDPRLLVDGRFCFAEPVEVEADASDATIQARVGGAVEVRLVPLSGLTPKGELRLMGGNWSGGGRGGWRSVEQDVSATNVVEFRGVDPDLTWTLMPSLEEQYAGVRIGIDVEPGRETVLEVDVSLGATVRGEVVDAGGQPMAGVRVDTGGGMPWMGGRDSRSIETADDGSFVLKGIPPGIVKVEAELDGWLDASTDEMEIGDGEERAGVQLVLERGLAIAGIVRGVDGRPAELAEVVVEKLTRQNWGGWGGSRMARQGRDRTDAAGRFAISGLAAGKYTVRANLEDEESDSTAHAVLEGVDAGGPEVVLELKGPIAFAGRVVDDVGEPVTSFRIDVESVDEGGPEERQGFEDDDGRFRFARVGPGAWEVRVRADGHHHPEPAELVLPGSGEELLLTVQRRARITGRVVSATGAPVAGASVRGETGGGRGGWGGWGGQSGPRAESDAEGAFALEEVAPGPLSVVARMEGWADSEAQTFELVPGDLREDVVLTLRVGGRIEGQVLTADGDPEPGKRVTWGSNAMGFGSRGEATSDAAGRFTFEHVTPGEWSVSAVPSFQELSDGMRTRGQSSFVEVMGDLVTETVLVVDGEVTEVFLGGEPRQPVRVFGVVSRAGEALAGAEVYAVSEGSAVFEGMKTARTDETGVYQLVVDRPGAHTISATMGDVGVEQVVEVPREEELRVDLNIPLGRIEGRVREPDGSPGKGVRLSLQRQDGLGRIRWAGGQKTADEEGRYAFEDLQPGTYTVRANVSTWGGGSNERFGASVVSDIEVGRDETVTGIDFELESAGTVTGLVVGSDGEPVGGASLYFRDAGGRVVSRVSQTVSDASGRFTKTGLAPGTYTVSARTASETAGDAVSVRVVSGETAEVRVALETGTIVVVTVEDEDGEARRARVQVLDENDREVGDLMTLEAMQAIFNEGVSTVEQRVGPFPPGRYTVRATMADGRTNDRRVRLRARDGEKRVKLKIDG